MSEDSLILAIGRLERAISRLESNVQSAVTASSELPPTPTSNEDHVSREEYNRLREAAEEAVSRIDRIIKAEST
ncbi:MAG: hypothetical protein AAGH53_02605 [Pseudomonadota bacterium]